MNLSAAYFISLNYGRAPEEGVSSFLTDRNKHEEASLSGEELSHPDYFFADFLQDHEDPRADIVRRDLEIRKYPGRAGNWTDKEVSYANSNTKVHHVQNDFFGNSQKDLHSPYGEFYGSLEGNKKDPLYRIEWHARASEDSPIAYYVGLFNSEEFKDLLQRLESPHHPTYFHDND